MTNIEEQYIKRLDSAKVPPIQEVPGQGKPAEKAVIEFFKTLPGITIRLSTPAEDSGLEQIGKDPAIDAVGYMNRKPVFVLQITSSAYVEIRSDKKKDRLNRAWVRLPEMSPQDPAIPRLLIYVDAMEISLFTKDQDFSKHPKLVKQIVNCFTDNLNLSLLQNPLPKEKELINKLLELVPEFNQQKSRPN